MNLSSIFQATLKIAERESPSILMALGITGFVSTVVLVGTEAPNAARLIENEEYFRKESNQDRMGSKEKILLTWKCYIPAAITGLASIGCFVCSNSIHLNRNAAMATLYTVSEAAAEEYRKKVVEIVGKNKEEKIHDAIVQDRLDRDPLSGKEVVVVGKGEALFYDAWSGRYFKSDMETIRRVQNDLNASMHGGEMYIPLNEFYYAIGLEPVISGNHIGWTIDYGMIDIKFTAKLAEGTPCVVMEYKLLPKDYSE